MKVIGLPIFEPVLIPTLRFKDKPLYSVHYVLTRFPRVERVDHRVNDEHSTMSWRQDTENQLHCVCHFFLNIQHTYGIYSNLLSDEYSPV